MQEEKQEANVDIKGTLVKLIKTDEPELNQEEAIMKYEEPKKKKVGSNNDDAQNGEATEEQEHLKRIKKELLASLERVKQLEKKIYGREGKENPKNELKVSEGGKHFTKEKDNGEVDKSAKKQEKQEPQKERE